MAKPYNGKSYKRVGEGKKNVLLHRKLAEKALGKPLPSKAQIHHLDGGIDGPIAICENNAYHALLHIRKRAIDATGNPHKRKCHYCKSWDDKCNMAKWPGRPEKFYHLSCGNKHLKEWKLKRAVDDVRGRG